MKLSPQNHKTSGCAISSELVYLMDPRTPVHSGDVWPEELAVFMENCSQLWRTECGKMK